MAYQQQGGLANGPGGSGEHHGPQGTEYTLQGKLSTLGSGEIGPDDGASGVRGQHTDLPIRIGVMRFLQIEWHNHERARNAWDIERAEMKAKIAKQEGEGRQAKRLNEQLDRQVRMLEMALRNERAKSKGVKVEEKKGADSEKEKKKNGEEKGTKASKRTRKLGVRPEWRVIKLTNSHSL
jgi:striatin 1/3/4